MTHCRVRQLLCTKYFHTLLLRCFGVGIVRSGRLCSLVFSIVIANNILLLAELIGQGSIGREIGQADTSSGLLCLFVAYILNSNRSLQSNKTFPTTFKLIFEFRIKSDSPNRNTNRFCMYTCKHALVDVSLLLTQKSRSS